MEAIPQWIFNLLAQRQAVILPGLGTLRVEHVPPALDRAGGGVTAPVNRVVFSLDQAEGQTLPEWIAERSGLPLKEVKPQYNRWVATLRRVSIDGEIVVEGVGMLLRQPDDSYRVEVSPELDRWLNPIVPKTVPLPARQPRPKKAAKKSRASRRAAWLAFGGAMLVILLYAGYYIYTRGFFDVPRAPVPPPPSEQSTPLDAAIPEAPTDTLPTGTASPASEPQSAPVPEPELPAGEAYHLIAGVFSNRPNAERFVREQDLEAPQTSLIPLAGGRYVMVSVGRHSTKAEADAALRQLKQRIPDAWISKRRN
jgi:hypothetical protein